MSFLKKIQVKEKNSLNGVCLAKSSQKKNITKVPKINNISFAISFSQKKKKNTNGYYQSDSGVWFV
jgi:hypothetical protein